MICTKESRGAVGLIKYFPARLYSCLGKVPLGRLMKAEEIRVGCGKPLMLFTEGSCLYVTPQGGLSPHSAQGVTVSLEEVREIFRLLLDGSVYAAEENIKNGYITAEGGHRVGICGSAVLSGGKISTIKDISYLNIRIAKEIKGSSELLFTDIFKNGAENCLIISPPGGGKTTLLRDICRVLGGSERFSCKLGIADERGELAAAYLGVPQNDIGARTCVMDGCPKAQAMDMLLRGMGVDTVVTDEIGSSEDEAAVRRLLRCGVKVIATMHAGSIDEARRRLGDLIGSGGFENIVVLKNKQIREMVRLDA